MSIILDIKNKDIVNPMTTIPEKETCGGVKLVNLEHNLPKHAQLPF